MLKLKQKQPEGADEVKLPIHVMFDEELGADLGGVRREFFTLLTKEIFTEAFGMFRYNEDVRLYWVNGYADHFETVPQSRKEQLVSYFELFGNIVGLAIFHDTLIDFPLPYFFFKLKFKGIGSITLEDFAQWQPETAKSLKFILDYDKEEECTLENLVCRTFSVDVTIGGDQMKTVDLIENGSEIYVNIDNREQFVRLFIEFEILEQAKSRCDAFWKGFSRFIDPLLL